MAETGPSGVGRLFIAGCKARRKQYPRTLSKRRGLGDRGDKTKHRCHDADDQSGLEDYGVGFGMIMINNT